MVHPAVSNEKWVLEEVTIETLDELVRRNSLNPGFKGRCSRSMNIEFFPGPRKHD